MNPSMFSRSIEKCSHTLGILAAFLFIDSSVTTQPSLAHAAAIREVVIEHPEAACVGNVDHALGAPAWMADPNPAKLPAFAPNLDYS